MSKKNLVVTRPDLQRLQELLRGASDSAEGTARPHLQELRDRLLRATAVEAQQMVPDVITMNSTIELFDPDRKETETITLVYPDEACSEEGKLSVLSLLGSALFGCRVGDEVNLQVPPRTIRRQVQKVTFQPERAGAFNL